uniref:Unannotated protein n=1 Tax=freshwater metagenome TaxID=449393 RepID=A0A6J6A1S5_9ZZZZ
MVVDRAALRIGGGIERKINQSGGGDAAAPDDPARVAQAACLVKNQRPGARHVGRRLDGADQMIQPAGVGRCVVLDLDEIVAAGGAEAEVEGSRHSQVHRRVDDRGLIGEARRQLAHLRGCAVEDDDQLKVDLSARSEQALNRRAYCDAAVGGNDDACQGTHRWQSDRNRCQTPWSLVLRPLINRGDLPLCGLTLVRRQQISPSGLVGTRRVHK